jgi:hypothetical protein
VRLRDGIGMFEKEDRNFLVGSLADIHCTVDAIRRLVPINLSGCEFDVVAPGSVTVLDSQSIAAEDDRHAMARVTVPRRALAGCETHPANQRSLASVENFLGHGLDSSRAWDASADDVQPCLLKPAGGAAKRGLR